MVTATSIGKKNRKTVSKSGVGEKKKKPPKVPASKPRR